MASLLIRLNFKTPGEAAGTSRETQSFAQGERAGMRPLAARVSPHVAIILIVWAAGNSWLGPAPARRVYVPVCECRQGPAPGANFLKNLLPESWGCGVIEGSDSFTRLPTPPH